MSLILSKSLVLVTATLLAVAYQADAAQQDDVQFEKLPTQNYQSFVKNWDENGASVLCALIHDRSNWDAIMGTAATMTKRKQIFGPDRSIYISNDLLIVSKVSVAPQHGGSTLRINRVVSKNGDLSLYYTYTRPKHPTSFSIKDYFAIAVPKQVTEAAHSIRIFEGDQAVCSLKP